ncbi:Uncharacterized protein APZ42_033612 [Daphnia magna]|uniref:DDE Tnp4 domain-containing protein n=1 Tax=Daphnia magna TaxID=35525 RepID=A0A164KY31_9CRUS|nr:Uncharacterized protein APZ42_033612 [Daphnia magna]
MDESYVTEMFEGAVALIFLARIKILLKQIAILRKRRPLDRNLETFYKFTRMSPQAFFYLVRKLNSVIKKEDTRLPKSITAGKRLAITLFFLVLETSKALYQVLAQDHLIQPDTEEWTRLSYEFTKIWNLPNCVGAIDGKHIAIQCPANSGSDYYNFKQFFSIVLMAVCDAKRWVDGSMGLPGPTKLPFSNKVTPHFFVGDDAFPLKTFMMKPCPGRTTGLMNIQERVFNYRLSSLRRVVENEFGILPIVGEFLEQTKMPVPNTSSTTLKLL